ncbi:hypothetical protein [Streptomyces sp. A5-4]|uniref:hypothetical protein n=1 Tax=Streptomyces sp. A5-4 TaxID=3384771 RepID=UPI003DA8A61A
MIRFSIVVLLTEADRGDDQHLRTLLQDLARVTDMLLRRRLYDGLGDSSRVGLAQRRCRAGH